MPVIQALALAILTLVTVDGSPPAHFVDAPNGAERRATELAIVFAHAAEKHGVDLALLVALAHGESGFDDGAISSARAFGILQLHPRYHRDIKGWCRIHPELCSVAVIDRGAEVLAGYKRKCRTDAGAISAYRSGRCQFPSDITRRVLATRRWIAARIRSAVAK